MVNPFAAPTNAGDSGAIWIIVASVSLVLLVALIVWFAWRHWPRRSTRDAAFLALSSRLRLRKRDRKVIRALARAHGQASPGALLLCPSALGIAIDRAAGAVDEATLERLRDRLSFSPGA